MITDKMAVFAIFELLFIAAVTLDLISTGICLSQEPHFASEIVNGQQILVKYQFKEAHPDATVFNALALYTLWNLVWSWVKPQFGISQLPRIGLLVIAFYPMAHNFLLLQGY